MSKLFKRCKGIVFSVALILSLADKEQAVAHIPHDEIDKLEISPTYNKDKILFITVRNNLFRSQDGGSSWKRIAKGLNNYSATFSSLAFSPGNTSIYLSARGAGIYKSQDKGSSWVKVNNGLGSNSIDLLDVASDQVVFATESSATKNGLYKTKNGGENWYRVLNTSSAITAIASSPNSNYKLVGDARGILYLSTDNGEVWRQRFQISNSGAIKSIAISPNFSVDRTFFVGTTKGGIFRTVNGGTSFSQVNNGVSDKYIKSLTLSPNYRNDSTIFASTWHEAVFRSTNGGNTWQKLSQGITKEVQAEQVNAPQFRDLRISPTFAGDKTIFLAGYDGLFKSINGGLAWKQIDTTPGSLIVGLALSPNYRNDSTLAVTTYVEDFYKTINKGITWTSTNKSYQGITTKRLGDIVFSPNYSVDNTILTHTYDYLLKSTDRGSNWRRIKCNSAGGFAPTRMVTSPNFASDKTIYFGTQNGLLFKSTDAGENCTKIFSEPGKIKSLAISAKFATEKVVYAAINDKGVYKTINGGNTWQNVSKGITNKSNMELGISPNHQVDKTVFVGTPVGLLKTTNGGQSWVELSGAAYGGTGFVETVAVSPNYQNDRTVIIHVQGKGLFKTVNGGQTFVQIAKNLINSNHVFANLSGFNSAGVPIKFSPSYSVDKTIYATTAEEVFQSTDGGNNWRLIKIPQRDKAHNH